MRDAIPAPGTLRARRIPEGTMVFAANLPAMFDPLAVPQPGRFRTDRPWDTYMLWGHSLHLCFGAHLNRATLPGLLKPLLARPSPCAAPKARGRIDTQGTPFPVHLEVVFEA
ncbi:hypothetical protein [Methylobacterium sp. 17Sr1-1]|uniref:hypothetical protein n=1 Tax=Methylobacterium sp. 17Sr1-1 TaxID=2202826 RepID=UPI0013A547F1|nr:hypothetical protein [Methylobacterium sp. 17Sr1-1]